MKKAVIFTLGCKVNEVESASLMRGIQEKGYEVSGELGFADIYILNTCAVTAEAEKKSRQLIARAKKYNPLAKIIVCGCAAEKSPKAFLEKENVTLVSGAQNKSKIPEILEQEGVFIEGCGGKYDDLPLPCSAKTRNFVKVQDGCDHFCSYCIVPYLRGRSRSRDYDSIVAEVEASSSDETVITGVDISTYNSGGVDLAGLMDKLKHIPTRIRLGSLEMHAITDRLLESLKGLYEFAPQFHLSMQSGSTNVLKSMNRHYTHEEYVEKCEMIYKVFPDAAITTDIIVGFPTETEGDFEDTLRIVDEVEFAEIHPFVYSPREGTVAAKMPQLDQRVKEERKKRMLQKADETQKRYLDKNVGKVYTFVAETTENGVTYGYTGNYIRVAVEGTVVGKVNVKLISHENNIMKGVIV